MKYFQMAVDLGNTESMRQYGWGLKAGYLGAPAKSEGMKYYKIAADCGDKDGCEEYAYGLTEGWLGSQDIPRAIEYYKKAAKLGSLEAEKYLEDLQNVYPHSFE